MVRVDGASGWDLAVDMSRVESLVRTAYPSLSSESLFIRKQTKGEHGCQNEYASTRHTRGRTTTNKCISRAGRAGEWHFCARTRAFVTWLQTDDSAPPTDLPAVNQLIFTWNAWP
jgi:hypothetical protein